MLQTQRTRLIAAPLALALVLTLAVGATAQVATLRTPDPEAEPSPAAEAELEDLERDEALLAYAQCLRDNDIEMDDPEAGARGGFFRQANGSENIDVQSEEFLAAQQECGPILEASRPDIDPEAETERLEENLALAQCLRDQGYDDYPDPVVGPDGRLERFGGRQLQEIGIDPQSEEFQTARQTCSDELGFEFGAGSRGQGGN
jgi:hypothetical protein